MTNEVAATAAHYKLRQYPETLQAMPFQVARKLIDLNSSMSASA